MTGQPNAMGGREVGGLANTLAGNLDFHDDNIDRLNRFWQTDKVPNKAGLMAVDLFDAIEEGKKTFQQTEEELNDEFDEELDENNTIEDDKA